MPDSPLAAVPPSVSPTSPPAESGGDSIPRIVWLHTQPEFYFNLMLDDLARGLHAPAGAPAPEYIAAFSYKGPGLYSEYPLPRVARSIILRPRPGADDRLPGHNEHVHVDWRKDLYPLKYDAVIVSGYGLRTHRELIRDSHRRGLPVAMWSDSNLRGERGRSLRARVRRRLKRAYLARIIGDTDCLLTANSLGVAYWRYYRAPHERIVLCPCYSDYGRIDAARQTSRAEVLARFGLPAAARVIFTSARLVAVKGLDTMIRAFREGGLAQRGWYYLIAGTGPLEAELKALAGDEKAIRLLGFQQPSDNLALMAHANLFVLPSRYEPHGIVIGEAMAGGTPVLASDVVGGAVDLVRRGSTGDIFRADDVTELVRKLGALLGDPARLEGMRPACRAQFERWFERTNPVRVVQALVPQMLARRRARGGAT